MQTTDDKTKTAGTKRFPLVIVIGRQFGSGGRRIGKILAEKLNCDYFDKELLSQAAESMGYAKEVFAAHDERKPSAFRTLLQGVYGIADNFHDISMSGERLYGQQSKVIREICNDKPCVIVGRTADYILRHHPGLLSVFLHSPLEKRAKDIVARGDSASEQEAIDMARKMDRDRESYYNYYTCAQNWGRADNYDITIDSSSLSGDEVAELILSYAIKKFGRSVVCRLGE